MKKKVRRTVNDNFPELVQRIKCPPRMAVQTVIFCVVTVSKPAVPLGSIQFSSIS